jgi:hypothetical protein
MSVPKTSLKLPMYIFMDKESSHNIVQVLFFMLFVVLANVS